MPAHTRPGPQFRLKAKSLLQARVSGPKMSGFPPARCLGRQSSRAGALRALQPQLLVRSQTQFRPGQVDASAFLAPGAVVLGDVTIGAQSSVWFGAVIRGDTAAIRIGSRTNIQDGCILHADPGFDCTIGDGVTVGHAAIVHGATVEDNVMIGMRAVVMNGARVGANSIVGAGAVVTEGMQIPPGSLVLGMPAKVARQLAAADLERIAAAAQHYVERAHDYRVSAAQPDVSGAAGAGSDPS